MKKTKKKLDLSKETVANLGRPELGQIAGGIVSSDNIECMMDRKQFTGSSYC